VRSKGRAIGFCAHLLHLKLIKGSVRNCMEIVTPASVNLAVDVPNVNHVLFQKNSRFYVLFLSSAERVIWTNFHSIYFTRYCWRGIFLKNNAFVYFVSMTYTFQTYAYERCFSTETTSNTYRPVYERQHTIGELRGVSAYKMTQLLAYCHYSREVVFAEARWTVEDMLCS
jgi:hypothetical protein